MNKLILYITVFYCCINFSFAQINSGSTFEKEISVDSLMESIRILSSAPFQGRKTGTQGQKIAASYLSVKLSEYGLVPLPGKNTFRQTHSLSPRLNEGMNIEAHQKTYLFLNDFFYISGYHDTSFVLQNILFAGYGISNSLYDDYRGVDVQGRAILFYEGEPPNFANRSQSKAVLQRTTWTTDWKKKLTVIYEKRPSIVFIVTKDLDLLSDSLLNEKKLIDFYLLAKGPSAIPIIFISEELALNFVPEQEVKKFKQEKNRMDKKTTPVSYSFSTDAVINISTNASYLVGDNILGMLNGRNFGEEYIIVSAHYDHLGIIDSILYPGADDNASGTAAVLELARMFSDLAKQGLQTKRNIVFAFFSGEENGLLGSSYFVNHPPILLHNIEANLNVDMIGRKDSLYNQPEKPDYIYLIGANRLSNELFTINEDCNIRRAGTFSGLFLR